MTADFSGLAAGTDVACAVSGGADSMALLWLLHTNAERLGIQVCAAHFNHRLRGEESMEDEKFVRDFCARNGIPVTVGSGDVRARSAETGESVEEAARSLRYEFLLSLPVDRVAVAHNADDNLETMLLNLLRGTGLRGLCGIPPERGKILRPLLGVSRAQILAYLAQADIPYRTDSTNLQPNCLRNRIRQQVVPLLLQENPRLHEQFARTARYLRQDEDFLQEQAVRLLADSRRADGAFCCAALNAAPVPLRSRAVKQLLLDSGVKKPTAKHIAATERLLQAARPSAQVQLAGVLLRREYDWLCIGAPQAAELPETVLRVPGCTEIPEAGLSVFCEFLKKDDFFENSTTTFTVKYDMISQSIIRLRPRQVGDTLTTHGGRKTLKKLLIERRIPRAARAALPVLADAEGVLAVYGIGVNEARRAVETEHALKITIVKRKKEAI